MAPLLVRRFRSLAVFTAALMLSASATMAVPIRDDIDNPDGGSINCPPAAVVDGQLVQQGLGLVGSRIAVDGTLVKVSVVYGQGCNKRTLTGLPFSWGLSGPVGSSSTLENDGLLFPSFVPDRVGDYTVTLTYCPSTCPNQSAGTDTIDIEPIPVPLVVEVQDEVVIPPATMPELPPSALVQGPGWGGRSLDSNGATIISDHERDVKCAFGGGTVDPQWVPVDEWGGPQDYAFVEGSVRRANIAQVDAEVNHYSHDSITMIAPTPATKGVLSWKPEAEGLIGLEWESNYYPGPMRASPGDIVSVFGFLILDCNHDPYYTEIHPAVLAAVQRARPIEIPASMGFGSNIHVPGVVTDIWANKEAGEVTSNCSDTGLHQPATGIPPEDPIVIDYGDCIKSPHSVDRVFDFRIYLPPRPDELMARAERSAPPAPLYLSIEGHPTEGSVGAPVPVVTPGFEIDDEGDRTDFLNVSLDLRGLTGKTYARRIVAGWAYPAPSSVADNWGLSRYRVAIPSMEVHDDKDWPDDGDWYFWVATNNRDQEWTRLLDGDGGNVDEGTHDFGDRPWRTGSSDPDRDLGPHLMVFPPEEPLQYSFDLGRRIHVHSSGYDAEFFDDPVGKVQDLLVPPTSTLTRETLSQGEGAYTLKYTITPLGSMGPEGLTAAGTTLSESYTIEPTEIENCRAIRDVCVLLPVEISEFVAWHPVDEPLEPDDSPLDWYTQQVFDAQLEEDEGLAGISLEELAELLADLRATDPERAERFQIEVREDFDAVAGTGLESEYARSLTPFELASPVDLWNEHFGDLDPTPPDLAVTGLAMDPPGAAAADEVVFSATVRNIGSGTAPASAVELLLDGASLGVLDVPALGGDEIYDVSFPAWLATRGPHELRFVADPLDEVIEAGGEQNAVVRTIDVGQSPRGLPDLHALGAQVTASDAGFVFSAKVQSKGGNVLEEFLVRFLVDGAVVGERRVDGVPAGTQLVVTSAPWSGAPGDHRLRIEVDAAMAVAESNEANNDHARAFSN